MAARVLAQILVMGSGILARGVVQAYRQALQNASNTGVTQETLRKGAKAMTEQEARQILGVSVRSSWDEVAQKYNTLFERNATGGSYYLQSKVHRAKEYLETVYNPKG
uniref:mitochondrial import inner membrane translocase subunit PAM16 like 2-like n=1 Tax=Erigeron canadensis TaxID=72917 RepID=UPI001CB933DD|nr:mitochondrial import inner membrane translocase subunit PAM16 like 2-like [Erigeron canadensis]